MSATSANILRGILPRDIAACERRADIEHPSLFLQELALVRNAVASRRREFATTRWCAHRVLDELGEVRCPLLSDDRGAPTWPAGIVGSLTHCTGFRAAAAARSTTWRAIGIDAETDGPLPDGVLRLVANPTEMQELRRLTRYDSSVHWDHIMFSCKEAIYKAWYSMAGTWLDFVDVEVSLSACGSFAANLTDPMSGYDIDVPAGFSGRWSVGHGVIATATAVPHNADARQSTLSPAPRPGWRPS
jgi:4'-phosphopantetheinyl transferase EntD